MRKAIYNSGIPQNFKSVNYSYWQFLRLGFAGVLALSMLATNAVAADWGTAEQELAKKIVAVTGPLPVSVTFDNRSSLGRRESDIVQNGLRSSLEQTGMHLVKSDQAPASITVTLSENETSYVWVAQIQQAITNSTVVMVSVPRSGRPGSSYESMPTTIHKIPVWTQEQRTLDVAVLEENGATSRIAVLGPEDVSIYRVQNGSCQLEQKLPVSHQNAWPLDLRGRLIQGADHTLTAYLPGVACRITSTSAPLNITCHAGDDPWPIVSASGPQSSAVFPSAGTTTAPLAPVPALSGFFAPARNYFTGVLSPAIGKFNTLPKFYSAAFVPREKHIFWLFASTDGTVRLIDGVNEQTSTFTWGSDIASVRTACGAGSQVLATGATSSAQDSVRAYEFPDRDPVAVSTAVDFPGPVSALWTETRGDTAIAIARNRDTRSYEAFRLSLSCGQ